MVTLMTSFIRDCANSNEMTISEKEQDLLAHNILVLGQMWTFRRWAVQKNQDIDEYIEQQTKQLLASYVQ